MAKLQSGNLILEIEYKKTEKEWIKYEVRFFWKDEIIINDNILKKTGEWWGKRPYATFIAEDYEKDFLISMIRKVLETNEPEYWEPIEPDVKMAIYPKMLFPFLKNHWVPIDDNDQEIKEEEIVDKEIRPDDLFTVITFVDTYNFKDCDVYNGEGISLHMIVERNDLEKFANDLEIEYLNIIRENND